jgi:hypothetical protein
MYFILDDSASLWCTFYTQLCILEGVGLCLLFYLVLANIFYLVASDVFNSFLLLQER